MKFFKTETRENILIAYFDNSENSNCFNLDTALELQELADSAEKKKLSGMIVTSDYKIFCSGGDLPVYAKQKKREQGLKINREISKILKNFTEISIPTIALVCGDCFGGGIEWISCFDKVFALPNAIFGMWQRRIALTWGWGGGHRLKMRMSKKDLQNLLISTELLTSYRALDIGMIDAIYTQELILGKAIQWIEEQKGLSNIVIKKIKKSDLKKEKKIFEELWMNPDHKEALKKFMALKNLKD